MPAMLFDAVSIVVATPFTGSARSTSRSASIMNFSSMEYLYPIYTRLSSNSDFLVTGFLEGLESPTS